MPESFDIGLAELKRGRGDLWLFCGFIPRRNFRPLRESLDHFSIGCVIAECFDLLIPEDTNEHWEELYAAATDGLEAISNSSVNSNHNGPLSPAIRTLRKLLRYSGFLERDFDEDHSPPEEQWGMLLDKIEQIIERGLQTRGAVESFMHSEKNTAQAAKTYL